jgi:hypothetical protein
MVKSIWARMLEENAPDGAPAWPTNLTIVQNVETSFISIAALLPVMKWLATTMVWC